MPSLREAVLPFTNIRDRITNNKTKKVKLIIASTLQSMDELSLDSEVEHEFAIISK